MPAWASRFAAFEGYSDLDEARFVIDEIRELIRDGIRADAVSPSSTAPTPSPACLSTSCSPRGVPYKVYGGLRFFERQEVKHALAYLRLLGNPDDDTAFLRVVNFPTRGIGARSLESLQATAHQINSSLYNAAASLTGKAGQTVGAFVRLIEALRQETAEAAVARNHCSRSSSAPAWSSTTGRRKEGQERLENLDELVNAAATFIDDEGAVGEGGALASFLAHASLEAGEHQAGEGQEAVQLMTVHSAKGLEFDVVFISGLEQGSVPARERGQLEGRDGLEEERRLMYVAVTRARQRLYLSCAQTRMLHGQTRYCLPSSAFLDEIPGGPAVASLNRKAVAEPSAVAPASAPLGMRLQSRSRRAALRIGQTVEHAQVRGRCHSRRPRAAAPMPAFR